MADKIVSERVITYFNHLVLLAIRFFPYKDEEMKIKSLTGVNWEVCGKAENTGSIFLTAVPLSNQWCMLKHVRVHRGGMNMERLFAEVCCLWLPSVIGRDQLDSFTESFGNFVYFKMYSGFSGVKQFQQ